MKYVGEMRHWNENSFLEVIAPWLELRGGRQTCREVRALASESSDQSRSALSAHIAGCAECRDLQQCLGRFDTTVTCRESEWARAECRLDNWLTAFLATEARVSAASRSGGWLRSPTWRTRWLLPSTAMAALALAFVVGRIAAPPGVQDTGITNLPPEEPVTIATAEPPKTAPLTDYKRGGSETAPSTPKDPSLPAVPRRAADVTHSVFSSEPLPKSLPNPVATPSARSSSPLVAQSPSVRPRPLPSAARQPSTGYTSHFYRLPGRETASDMSLQPEITVDAGAHIWISLESVRPGADGSLEFRGILLLPVMQGGAMLLDRNTGVAGSVSTVQDKISIQISELVLNGSTYRLTSANGAANLSGSESGQALKFESGRVLEAWMASVSVYEKRAGDSKFDDK